MGRQRQVSPNDVAQQGMAAALQLHRAGRFGEAAAAYRAVLKQAPKLPEALNNLGVVLRALGDGSGAIAAYRKAVKARPGYAAAHDNLAAALADSGDGDQAVRHHLDAMRHGGDAADGYRLRLIGTLRRGLPLSPSPRLDAALVAALRDPAIDPQDLDHAAQQLILKKPGIAALERAIAAGAPIRLDDRLGRALDDELLLVFLSFSVVSEDRLEAVLTGLRSVALAAIRQSETALPGPLSFWAALAVQAALNGYGWTETPEETEFLSGVRPSGGGWSPAILARALFRPPGPDFSPPENDPALALLRTRLVVEPAAERQIAGEIPRLDFGDGGTEPGSATPRVKAQYEAHPYPRWQGINRRPARPLRQILGELFPDHPDIRNTAPEADRLTLLVAGCGTGKHAIEAASRFAGTDVTAVDLSRASLAHGIRMAKRLGIGNIRWAEADLTLIDETVGRFHIIESVGVLHHMADPEACWSRLRDLLLPGGLMRIGLYSRSGRTAVAAARDRLREAGLANISDDGSVDSTLRAARAMIRKLAPEDPAREVMRSLDFYSLPGFRDLLLHAQERDYDLGEIGDIMARLKLELIGFEIHDPALARGTRSLGRDLARWQALETEQPGLFQTMYQFWCRPAR